MRLASLTVAGGCALHSSDCACAESLAPQPRDGAGPGGRRARLVIGRTGRRAPGLATRARDPQPGGGIPGKTLLGLWTGLRGARFRSPLLLRVAVPAAFPRSFSRGCAIWVARPRAPPPLPPPGSLRFHQGKGFSSDVARPEVVGPVRLPAVNASLAFCGRKRAVWKQARSESIRPSLHVQ